MMMLFWTKWLLLVFGPVWIIFFAGMLVTLGIVLLVTFPFAEAGEIHVSLKKTRARKVKGILLLLIGLAFLGAMADANQAGAFLPQNNVPGGGVGYWLCNPPLSNIICANQGSSGAVTTNLNSSQGLQRVSTSSGIFVSSGFGVSLTVKNTGHVEVQGIANAYVSGPSVAQLEYSVYLSKTGIPALGSAPNAGDMALGPESDLDPSAVLNMYPIPLQGFTSGVTGTFYVYIVFKVGNVNVSNNLNDEILTVQEF